MRIDLPIRSRDLVLDHDPRVAAVAMPRVDIADDEIAITRDDPQRAWRVGLYRDANDDVC